MFQTAAYARDIVAGCCEQHRIARGPRSFDTTSQQLATQQIKEKRIARAHATRSERVREKLSSGLEFHATNASRSVKFTFPGTSVRQPKSIIPSHLEYEFGSYFQDSKLQYAF